MFKLFKALLLSVGLLLIFSFSHGSVLKPDIDSITSYAVNIEPREYNNFSVYRVIETLSDGSKSEITYLRSKENTADHDYFDWEWTLHVLKIHYYPTHNRIKLEIISRDYKDFITIKSRGFEQWVLVDINLDGIIDIERKSYTILVCENDECKHTYIIRPTYPEGFINPNWFILTKEEVNKKYEKEINYWMKTIWGEK